MITGGDSYEALITGAHVFWHTNERISQLSAYGNGGIGLFNHGLLDTHFANRGRQGRMIELLVDTFSYPSGDTRAFGIDENTAMVVSGPWGGRQGKVLGERGVLIMDISTASIEDSVNSDKSTKRESVSMFHTRIDGVSISRMSSGDLIDLSTLVITPAEYKRPMTDRESDHPVKISEDIFSDSTFQFDLIAQSLFSSTATMTYGLTVETKPAQLIVSIGKYWNASTSLSQLRASGFDGIDPDSGIYAYSYVNMWLSIAPYV